MYLPHRSLIEINASTNALGRLLRSRGQEPCLAYHALVGPGAVADLLRLATAARRGRSLLRPVHLAALTRAGLVTQAGEQILVRTTVPRLSPRNVRRLHRALREEHRTTT